MQSQNSNFQINDGGRAAAGFLGKTGDCVTRAIAIATGKTYKEVYDGINHLAGKATARTGVSIKIVRAYMAQQGWKWVPTMFVGQGCKTHLTKEELPSGRLVVRLSKHMVAVVDGVVHDTYDSTRNGKRCVYGYFVQVN
jgi:hypothetical protein